MAYKYEAEPKEIEKITGEVLRGLKAPEVEDAVEVFREKDKKKFIVTHFKDGSTSICTDDEECYTAEDKKKELYYIMQAFYANGFKVKELI